MLTARQFAEALNRPYQTVMNWLQAQLVPGAELVETPIGSYYQVPAHLVQTFVPPKRGRPKKAANEGAAEPPKSAKKARKKGN